MVIMTNSITDLLQTDRFKQPAEVGIIKDFVQAKFQEPVQVSVSDTQIIIGVPSAALAGALQPFVWELTRRCNTKKRLRIQIQH